MKKKVYLVIKDELEEGNYGDIEIVGQDVVGVYESRKVAEAQAAALRYWALKNNEIEFDNIHVYERDLETEPTRHIGNEKFKCVIHLQVEFSKTYKTCKVWWKTRPIDDDYEEYAVWTRDHRVLVIEMTGMYDGHQKDAKVSFEELMKIIDSKKNNNDYEYWEMARDAIAFHHKEFPGMYGE